MKTRKWVLLVATWMVLCQVSFGQAKVDLIKFQRLREEYNTQHADGYVMKCMQAFELKWDDPLQQKKKVEVHLPHQRGEHVKDLLVCEWDPVFKAWKTVKGTKVKKYCMNQQEFDFVELTEGGIYGLFVAMEHRRNVMVQFPENYRLKSFELEDPTLQFVYKYNQALNVKKFKIPLDLPPTTAVVNAVFLDKKGKRIEIEGCPLERLDELTTAELEKGIWTVDLAHKTLTAENKLNPKKQKNED
jgi:hypothetical protein